MSSKHFDYCSKTQLEEILAEFNATEKSMRDGVQYLKEWMKQQPHLPDIEDDEWLFNLLLRNKNSLEITKKKIDGYYTIRTLMPEMFQDRDPCSQYMINMSRQACYLPVLKLTPDGSRVIIFKIFEILENSVVDPDGIMKLSQIAIDISLKLDKVRGTILVYDFQNLSLNFVGVILSNIKKYNDLTAKANPGRYEKIYILNMKSGVEPIIRFVKTFMKKKLTDRFVIWKDDPKKLATVLPKEVLPTAYGGDEEITMEELRDIWFEEVKKYRDWFISDEKNKADLSKRPVANLHENNDAINCGTTGSFRLNSKIWRSFAYNRLKNLK
ncbi:retinaldehyde-binding protein 1-like [Planococcus citri]|uniref:retinaldehyde-binding protein 1-like n=1 Tax=Planococcus citri TaxID=170843 RepID=UPI0031F8D5E7